MYKLQTDCASVISCGNSGADWFVRDLNDRADRIYHLNFHVEHGDYFAVLATIINIALNEKDLDMRNIFAKLYEDLQYLQENYDIVRKKK